MKESYLTKNDVQQVLWKAFERFMKGQTVMQDKDGEILFYKQDVDNFLTNPERRFWD